jgi:lantibiotic leader peptide-processing serine protease
MGLRQGAPRMAAAIVLLSGTMFGLPAAQAAPASAEQTYIVLFNQSAVPADTTSRIAAAGGSLVYAYDAIGVAIARSATTTFRSSVLKDNRVSEVAATTGLATRLDNTIESTADASGAAAIKLADFPAADSDTFSGLQWDMTQIHAQDAHKITGGNRAVLVGDLDTGLDYTHPDLAPNVDKANSASCVGGVPNQSPAAWDDDNGHGTHTAGTIAAAGNGIGIVGVAPNVRIAAVKVGNPDGFFFPEAVVCAFMWAASHQFNVTNNSYFADPWLFNCKNDPAQRAIWNAERRAIRYAISQGVTVVAAAGNFSDDLAHPTIDPISPDDTVAVERDITNACAVIPVEVPGVIGVSATGNLKMKSYYSSYGKGQVQVAAPGGDRRLQIVQPGGGRVLSTYPAKFFAPGPLFLQDCSAGPCATYAYLQGTSMASPHVAGVAALIARRLGTDARAGAVQAIITQTADSLTCPTAAQLALYAPFPSFVAISANGAPQTCTGGPGNNSWFGHGLLNALSAVNKAGH